MYIHAKMSFSGFFPVDNVSHKYGQPKSACAQLVLPVHTATSAPCLHLLIHHLTAQPPIYPSHPHPFTPSPFLRHSYPWRAHVHTASSWQWSRPSDTPPSARPGRPFDCLECCRLRMSAGLQRASAAAGRSESERVGGRWREVGEGGGAETVGGI